MKNHVIKHFLFIVFFGVFLSGTACAQNKPQEFKWNSGYCEKVYKVNDTVIQSLFSKIIPAMYVAESRGKLNDNTEFSCEGIGDSTGRYHNFRGLGTIKQMKIPAGGITFCHYTKKSKDGTVLGFKFEDNKELPVQLHKLFKKNIGK